MKRKLSFLILFSLSSILAACSDDSDEQAVVLPLATQTGANTFGVLINNQVFYPRDEQPDGVFSSSVRSVIFWGAPEDSDYNWYEIDVRNSATGKPATRMILHLQNVQETGLGEYIWGNTNFHSDMDGPMYNHMYCLVHEKSSNSWEYYGSFENSGKVIITRFDGGIISGTFSGTIRSTDGAKFIDINDGRFDINTFTLPDTAFP